MRDMARSSSEELPPPVSRTTLAAAIAVLLLTLAFALVWSHYKLFWSDELLEYYTDSKPTLAAIIFGQLLYPFSLEPPAFHLLLHLLLRILPHHHELASRLPSIVALLVTEICVFRIVWRLTRVENAALFAMAMPFFLVTIDYAPEARVYSLLTALFALAMVCYQAATEPAAKSRTLALFGLWLALSSAILLHYYAVFLLLPFLVAEAVRTLRIRRADWALWLALAAAMAAFLCNLPFMEGLHPLQAHYFDNGDTRFTMIAFTYLWFFWHFDAYKYLGLWGWHVQAQFYLATAALLALSLVPIFLNLRARWSHNRPGLPTMVALTGGLLLPVLHLVVAHLITHAYAPRYSLPAVISISVLMALGISPWLRRRSIFLPLWLSLLAASSLYAVHHIRMQAGETGVLRIEHAITPELRAAIEAQPDHHIYMQDLARFLTTSAYLPAEDKPLLVAVRSADRELQWMHQDTSALYAENIGRTTPLQVLAYESLLRHPGPYLFVIYGDPAEEWIGRELFSDASSVIPLGNALGGRLYRITFPQPLIPARLPL